MKKVTIKGVDGKEIEAYICSDHPDNFPTDMTDHKVEEVGLNKHYVTGNIFDDPNKLIEEGKADWMSGNEQDVNENSAGGGIHATSEYPAMVDPDATEEEIKKWAAKKKKEIENYDSPLDKAFDYGYNVDVDPLNKLFKMVSNKFSQNKVKLDDTIDSDLIDTKDLKMGKLYRVAGIGLIARFMGQFMLEERGVTMDFVKTQILLKIKHHGTLLYVGERQLVKASDEDVADYLNEPF